jgi:thiamine kinase-like enzyme
MSDFGQIFTGSLCWPECYHAEINKKANEIQIWMEYIDGVSGSALTIGMLEEAALELGRFQGKCSKRFNMLQEIGCLGDPGFMEREFSQWHKSSEYACLRSSKCDIPKNLKQMLIDIDDHKDEIFNDLKGLPVVLCHRDFWNENIFFSDNGIRLIDWDTSGWGFLGEDIASLIADGMGAERLEENFRSLVPAYLKGISEYMDVPLIDKACILTMILIKFGYRMTQEYMFSDNSDEKNRVVAALQKIYEMRNFV